jgi:hypothetical protein
MAAQNLQASKNGNQSLQILNKRNYNYISDQ